MYVESSLFPLYLFQSASGSVLCLYFSGFCFYSSVLCHRQLLFGSACHLLLFSWCASSSLLKGSLKPSSQIRRKAVLRSSYFRCWTSSMKGIKRSLQIWTFSSVSRKGLSLFITNYSSPRPYPEGSGLKVMLLTCLNVYQILLPPPVLFLPLNNSDSTYWLYPCDQCLECVTTGKFLLGERACNIINNCAHICIYYASWIFHFKALPSCLLPGSLLLCQSCNYQSAYFSLTGPSLECPAWPAKSPQILCIIGDACWYSYLDTISPEIS